jgi:hypothetical protein
MKKQMKRRWKDAWSGYGLWSGWQVRWLRAERKEQAAGRGATEASSLNRVEVVTWSGGAGRPGGWKAGEAGVGGRRPAVYRLRNGLTAVVRERHSVPLVVVEVSGGSWLGRRSSGREWSRDWCRSC